MPSERRSPRPPLTKERIVQAAVELIDRDGLAALTMRRLGAALDVEAMALYKHVANKEEILDGVVELVVGEIELPDEQTDWKQAMRGRAISARQVLGRHSWAIGLLEAQGAMGPIALRYLDTILGTLRSAGFSIENAAHAFWVLDSYVYGHVIQETSMSLRASDRAADSRPPEIDAVTIDEFPHLLEVARHAAAAGYTVDREFEFGLELLLGALEELREPPPR